MAARWQEIELMQPSFQVFLAACCNQNPQAASRNRAGSELSRAVARFALAIFRKPLASERTMEQLPLPIGLPDHMALPVLTFRHFRLRKQQQIQRHIVHGQPAP